MDWCWEKLILESWLVIKYICTYIRMYKICTYVQLQSYHGCVVLYVQYACVTYVYIRKCVRMYVHQSIPAVLCKGHLPVLECMFVCS